MNVISIRVPIHKIKDNLAQGSIKTLNYTVVLNEARLSNYNYSINVPARTVIMEDTTELLKMDWDASEFNINFIQKKLMNEYDKIKFRMKKVSTGLLGNNEIVSEILEKTPIYIDKDSISDSLEILKIKEGLNSYESIIPQTLLTEYLSVKKSTDRIRPLETSLNMLSIREGIMYTGRDIAEFKKKLRIKNYPEKSKFEFQKGFYSLGQLSKLSLELDDIWNR